MFWCWDGESSITCYWHKCLIMQAELSHGGLLNIHCSRLWIWCLDYSPYWLFNTNSSHTLQSSEIETLLMNQRNHGPLLLFFFYYPSHCWLVELLLWKYAICFFLKIQRVIMFKSISDKENNLRALDPENITVDK